MQNVHAEPGCCTGQGVHTGMDTRATPIVNMENMRSIL